MTISIIFKAITRSIYSLIVLLTQIDRHPYSIENSDSFFLRIQTKTRKRRLKKKKKKNLKIDDFHVKNSNSTYNTVPKNTNDGQFTTINYTSHLLSTGIHSTGTTCLHFPPTKKLTHSTTFVQETKAPMAHYHTRAVPLLYCARAPQQQQQLTAERAHTTCCCCCSIVLVLVCLPRHCAQRSRAYIYL